VENTIDGDVPEESMIRNQTIDDYHSVASIQEEIDRVSGYENELSFVEDSFTSLKDSPPKEHITNEFESKALKTIMEYLEKVSICLLCDISLFFSFIDKALT
jgi:hypothetical protein